MALTEYRGFYYNPETKLFYLDEEGKVPQSDKFTFENPTAGMWPFGWPVRQLNPFDYATKETAERVRAIMTKWLQGNILVTLECVENKPSNYFGFQPSIGQWLIRVNYRHGTDMPLELNAGGEASKIMRNTERWCRQSFFATLKTAGIDLGFE